MTQAIKVLPGKSYPIGATVYPGGVNFCLFTKFATRVELLLFDRADHRQPRHVIALDPQVNKSYYYWHCFIPGIGAGQLYGYRAHGPFDPENGFRFDGDKVLIDPYARAVVTDTYNREAAQRPGDNCATSVKSVVVDPNSYDWENDHCLNYPFDRTVIYEMHVGGFTKHPSSGVPARWRGTYRGLIEKIPYLQSLGVTAVELMPVQQFDPYDSPSHLHNYWGYSPMAFFAPHDGYSASSDPVAATNEFRDMVKALHRAGIEVIIDIVFNHSAEGNHEGPTLSMKGLENLAYYILEPQDKSRYLNFSGTGNSINGQHSIVRRMIRDCLRMWVTEYHIDGFRFDLAAVLSRGEDGKVMENPPLLWSIESDPILATTKIIAEAWDLESYQLGRFTGHKWAEWNGQFRDDVRRFIKSDRGSIRLMANRLAASPDVFPENLRNPNRSINFVTCHDGFTLNDLVSYNRKHNLDNLEENRDGANDNHSWNCGVEGPTDDPAIEMLRLRQIKNFLTILLISQGTPMLLMGDEVRRTQKGNNNAYCQDNGLSWFDWTAVEREAELLRFVRQLIRFNLTHRLFQESQFWGRSEHTQLTWHGIRLNSPDWSEHSHALAYTLSNANYGEYFHFMINAYWDTLAFELPDLRGTPYRYWHCLLDTARPQPAAEFSPNRQNRCAPSAYNVLNRSVVILQAK